MLHVSISFLSSINMLGGFISMNSLYEIIKK